MSFWLFDRSTLGPTARAAVDGLLVLGIALEGALIAAIGGAAAFIALGLLVGTSTLGDLGERVFFAAPVPGALLAAAVAGWRVLGGWRGALRAVLVVAIAAAAGLGTYHSPLIVVQRGPDLLAAVGAGLGAGAFGALALLRPAPPADPA